MHKNTWVIIIVVIIIIIIIIIIIGIIISAVFIIIIIFTSTTTITTTVWNRNKDDWLVNWLIYYSCNNNNSYYYWWAKLHEDKRFLLGMVNQTTTRNSVSWCWHVSFSLKIATSSIIFAKIYSFRLLSRGEQNNKLRWFWQRLNIMAHLCVICNFDCDVDALKYAGCIACRPIYANCLGNHGGDKSVKKMQGLVPFWQHDESHAAAGVRYICLACLLTV